MTSCGVRPVASRHSVVTSARRCYLARPTCATFAKNQSRCTWSVCVQDLTIVWLVVGKGGKFLRGAMGYIRGGEWVEWRSISIKLSSSLLLHFKLELQYRQALHTSSVSSKQTTNHQNEQLRLPPARSFALIRLNPIFFHPHNTLLTVSAPIPRVSTRRPPLRQSRGEDSAQAQSQHQEDVGRRQEACC